MQMPIRELKEKYGRSRGAINRAIRAEIPAGNEVLDSLELFHKIAERYPLSDNSREYELAQLALDRLREIANEMEAEIRRRYGMPPLE
jgi:hypothetical protein